MAERVIIIGGGLAGLAAATALAWRGLDVTLFESRTRLGGRAGSFTDTATGQIVDACQHVSMGCCTNFYHFCQTVGIGHLLRPQPRLYFLTPDGQVSRFGASPLPAPLHLSGSFFGLHFLSLRDKLRISWGLAWLRRDPGTIDPPFADWLARHGQTPKTVARFWGLVLVSALNETPERMGLRYARKVFLDGFLGHRRGFEVWLPSVPLDRLYGSELQAWCRRHGVQLVLGEAVRELHIDGRQVVGLTLRSGANLQAQWYITAVPFDRLLDLLPTQTVAAEPYFGNLRKLQTSPITSVHLWYDRPVMKLPHAVLVDCVGQWVFNRGEVDGGEHYVQVVVSAARSFRSLGHEQVQQLIAAEIARLFPMAAQAQLLRARVVTEHAATFSPVPCVDSLRPEQTSPLRNLFVAGDWTATDWPATMEGAVRSGYLAAEALLKRRGTPEQLVQPDLGVSP